MQNRLDRDEIYQILPGPRARRAGWLRLLHSFTEQRKASLEAVMLTFGRHVVDTVSASLGPWQSEGGVSMNQVSRRLVLSSCTVLFRAARWHLLPCFGPHQLLRFPPWSWDQLPCWY